MNKQKVWKLLPVWCAVSAVIVIAGIILMALLGFNTAADIPGSTVLEVEYNVVVLNNEEAQGRLDQICEEALSANGIAVKDRLEGLGESSSEDTGVIRYVCAADVTEEARAAVEKTVEEKAAADEVLGSEFAEVSVNWHAETMVSGTDYVWRGAIAVGIVVALVYVGIRFGVGCALTGLALAVHDSLFVLALLAILRIPVYASAPVVYAAIAAVLSIVFWLVHCIKLRELKKAPETRDADAEDAVAQSYQGAWKWIVGTAAALAVSAVVLAAFAGVKVLMMVLPALLCVLAALYSSLLLGPALHIPVKRAFDKMKKAREKGYSGKTKQTEQQ